MRRTEIPPLGVPDPPDVPPTPAEWRAIKSERCRRKLAAFHTKRLAAAVFREFGDAALPVLAAEGISIDADGTVRSEGEDQVDDQFCELYSMLTMSGRTDLFPPCDVHLDPDTAAVRVTPDPHDRLEASDGVVRAWGG